MTSKRNWPLLTTTLRYWPATAEFVGYRSQLAAPNSIDLRRSNLPNCTDQEPHKPMVLAANPKTFTIRFAYYENCRFTLDSPTDNAKVNTILLDESVNLTFRHCFIVYRGGEINLILEINHRLVGMKTTDGKNEAGPLMFSGKTLLFEDSVFDFPIDSRAAKTRPGIHTADTCLE